MMKNLLEQLAICVEYGKVDRHSPFPPDMQGQDGAAELTEQALAKYSANDILQKALTVGMRRIGDKFGAGEAFIPELLIAAKAMQAAMALMQPYFESGEVQHRGSIILGTVTGDLHDIGKNIVKMVLKGDGWNVIDLGVDVSAAKFIETLEENSGSHIGLSALLTTTMLNMEKIVREMQGRFPATQIYVGGAPLSQAFCDQIGANGYFENPQSFAQFMAKTI
ncbi:MAG: B12-binding domain-containing protein [bacterium]